MLIMIMTSLIWKDLNLHDWSKGFGLLVKFNRGRSVTIGVTVSSLHILSITNSKAFKLENYFGIPFLLYNM